MKHLLFTLIFMSSLSLVKAQDISVIGTWNINEFTMVKGENTDTTTESTLKENNSVWDLTFLKNGTLKQSSNMRNGSLESQEGTWTVENDNLILSLIFNGHEIKIEYKYEQKENVLVLKRSNPMGTMKIITKFKKAKEV